MSAGWTEDELNNPLVQEAIRRKEEELKRQEELARNPFANVQSAVDTVPAAPEEQSGLSALLDSLDESVSRNRQAHRDALVGGGKRSLGAGMQAAEEHGQAGLAAALRGVYETLNFEQGSLAGYVLRNAFQPDQVESGAELFQEGSKQ